MRKVKIANLDILSQVGEMVKAGATVTLQVKGNSMLPFIVNERDSVVLAPVEGSLKPTDVVLALVDGGVYVLHRIIRVEGEEIWLRGDGCLRRSVEHSSRERVAGRAVRFVRNGREIDCYSVAELRKLRLWNRLLPIRRYLLAVYRIVFRGRIYRKKGK
jgi:hypothetical protein